jgi:hypothetical protein
VERWRAAAMGGEGVASKGGRGGTAKCGARRGVATKKGEKGGRPLGFFVGEQK